MTIISGKPCTTSRLIAECFERQHFHVLGDIKTMDSSADFRLSNFGEAYYINEQNKEQPEYIITRDGFSLLAMGFNGKSSGLIRAIYFYVPE